MREDDDLFLPELALFFGEQLAAQRLRAEHAEERRRDDHRLDALRLRKPRPAQRDAGFAKQPRLFEHRHVALAIEVVGHAVVAFGHDAGARILVEDADQPVRLGERQRLQEHPVDDRKDCDVGRQAQRQRGNGREGEAAVFPEQPGGKTEIL